MQKFLFMATLLFATSVMAEPVTLIVDFDDDATMSDVIDTERDLGVRLTQEDDFSAWKMTTATVDSSRVDALIDKVKWDLDIENIEVAQTYSVPEDELAHLNNVFDSNTNTPLGGAPFDTPNDEYYKKQRWNFDMINLEAAWEYSTGKGAVVAVLDTGVSDGKDSSHPRIGDLKNTCFVEGYNFVDGNKNPYDVQSHGTHVASSVAESTNNKIGGVGVAFEACIMPMKVLSDQGYGSTQDIALGIRKATDNGAHIINMSLGGGGHSKILADAVKYAADRNVLVFCAAGNGSRPRIEYPAAYDGCLAISSVGPDEKLAYYSSYGEGGDGVFIASPGGNKRDFGDDGGVWQSTVNPRNPKEWGMFPYQGTSMATPIAAGVGALLVSYYLEEDGEYDREEIMDLLQEAANDKKDSYRYGAGIIDAGSVLAEADASDTSATILALFLSATAFWVVRRVGRGRKA